MDLRHRGIFIVEQVGTTVLDIVLADLSAKCGRENATKFAAAYESTILAI